MPEVIGSLLHIGWIVLKAFGAWCAISAVVFMVLYMIYSIKYQFKDLERRKKIRKNAERRLLQQVAIANRIAQEKAARQKMVNGDSDGKTTS